MPKNDNANGRKKNSRFDIHPVVFFWSAGLIFSGLVFTLAAGDAAKAAFQSIHDFMTAYFTWFFVLVMNVVLAFSVVLIFSRFGKIRIGGPDAEPEFSAAAWFAMLFSAGMGIGILFYSVAEPLLHYSSIYVVNPLAGHTEMKSLRSALEITFLHWGLHPWGIYALVGLAIGFFGFTHNLPLSIRNLFYPLLGDRIHGWPGNVIDILAAIATLYGVATSLGLGVQQVNAGLGSIFEIPVNTTTQILLIAAITAAAAWSVIRGLHKGIKFLSKINLIVAGTLMTFVFVAGPTHFILKSFFTSLGDYATDFLYLAFTTGESGARNSGGGVSTTFYWGWWIAWSPFVGMFIARVSYGRTIRQYLIGVLIAPALATFFWMSVFGASALHIEIFGETGLAGLVRESIPVSLFAFFGYFPLSELASILAVIVVITFFVTSSDSGSLVIDIITAGGNPDPPKMQRLFWALLEGAVAAVLLVGGGLIALQTAAITTGFPFGVVILLMCWSIYKGLRDYQRQNGGKP